MKTQDQIDWENFIEAQKMATAEKFEREELRQASGRHRAGKERNKMTHLMPKKKKRKS